jgi:hypothetical protein
VSLQEQIGEMEIQGRWHEALLGFDQLIQVTLVVILCYFKSPHKLNSSILLSLQFLTNFIVIAVLEQPP